MTADESTSESFPRTRRIRLILAVALITTGCGQPQIGDSKEAFKTVDALYTAVGLRDVSRVDRCASTLKAQREAGTLPASAADSLESIITEAKGGGWEAAQARLATFMEGQAR
ncbi:hypothetical protein ACYOEI_04560 [Singulisphaera rosea]